MFDIRKIQEQALFDAVQAASDSETAAAIVYGTQGQIAENNAAWVKSAMRRLENRFDESTVERIRMNCQCGYAMDEKLALVKELMASSSSLQEFAGLEKARAAGIGYEDGSLTLRFLSCPCPILADVDKLDSYVWCRCTTGYSKVLFEKAFGCEVDVILLKSIKAGDEICLMKIIPLGRIWQ